VQFASVALATETAQVVHGAEVSAAALVEEVEDIGFEAAVKSTAPNKPEATVGGSSMRLRITGMTCSACSTAVESALKGCTGVRTATVSVTTEQAEIEVDSSKVVLENVLEAVEDIGFEAELIPMSVTNTIQLTVGGMTCSACSGAVEKALLELPAIPAAPPTSLPLPDPSSLPPPDPSPLPPPDSARYPRLTLLATPARPLPLPPPDPSLSAANHRPMAAHRMSSLSA
ncbi:copper-transporting ATPase, partial [Cymbomonas tetramitiformis]